MCRFILYGLRAHALRLSGCWVSVRRSTSSYFDRVAILTDIFSQTNVGQKVFFAFIYSLLPLCLQYNLRTREPQWLPPLPLQLLGRITLPATIIPHTVLRSLQYRCPNKVIFPPPPQLLSVITPLSIYYYPVTTFYSFCFHLAAYSKANKKELHHFEWVSWLGPTVMYNYLSQALDLFARGALHGRLERVSLRDNAVVLVLGALRNERCRLRHET